MITVTAYHGLALLDFSPMTKRCVNSAVFGAGRCLESKFDNDRTGCIGL